MDSNNVKPIKKGRVKTPKIKRSKKQQLDFNINLLFTAKKH